MPDHQKWADEQMAVLLDIGVDLPEAQRSTAWVLDNLPDGEDPAEWIPPAHTLDTPLDDAAIQDARNEWYAKDAVMPRFKRLLDAKGVEGDG